MKVNLVIQIRNTKVTVIGTIPEKFNANHLFNLKGLGDLSANAMRILAEQSKLEAGSYVSYVIMMAEVELPNDSEDTEQ